ncbi:MAG: gluconate 2-dehydrogenase subunit 3 family protein [Proteobacteria bacterium]|nr:gluconate 2-dehydrogenase subunit 3 family protein [Pseudomonadota bacterium]
MEAEYKSLRIDRRTTIRWVLAASAAVPMAKSRALHALTATEPGASAQGYGTDPALQKTYAPGELWPLTFTPTQRKTAAALCDLIIPADAHSPSASAVGVVDFIDEWVSAPYPALREDRRRILAGFEWLDAESGRRAATSFAALTPAHQSAICEDICSLKKAAQARIEVARFFALYRDLTAGGFYSSAAGRADLQYMGNVPLRRFDGPPQEVLKAVGLA